MSAGTAALLPEIFRGANGPISTQALTNIFGRHFPSFVSGSENYGGDRQGAS
jgi:hypothetical protein